MFRFTIRELLILTVTAGLAVGWWSDRQHLKSQLAQSYRWRTIAGGLERIFLNHGLKVGIEGNRLWVGSTKNLPVLWGKVGLDEFEPTLDSKEEPPLESYYANWPRKPDTRNPPPSSP